MKSLGDLAALLGFLRLTLLGFALANASLAMIDLALPPSAADTTNLWTLIAGIVAPVLAPLFAVVIFFDYLMSRVRAADDRIGQLHVAGVKSHAVSAAVDDGGAFLEHPKKNGSER